MGSWSDAAVLVRRNSDVADLHAALVGRQIPVLIANLSGLLQLPDVALVVAHLRVLADRRDNQAWATLLSAARFGLSPADLAEVGRRARELARIRAIEDGEPPAGEQTQQPEAHLADAVADPGELDGRSRLASRAAPAGRGGSGAVPARGRRPRRPGAARPAGHRADRRPGRR
ncbi:MAG: hypothetical protein LKI24_10565 [Acidipropionibacterium sp.]|nr:hypothetical protein [Acidipropionibacterium sp.]